MIYLIGIAFITACTLKISTENMKKNSERKAVIYCRAGSLKKFRIYNIKDCASALLKFPSYSSCPRGCAALMSCISVCPRGAIDKELNVNYDLCLGCGKCVQVCPREFISLEKISSIPRVLCSFNFKAGSVEKPCAEGCQKCYICVSICPRGAICPGSGFIPETDPSKCISCGKCVKKCPSGVRVILNEK